ncbi:polysaccharide pyruvyl transferase family protein [Nocardioides sp. zg-DK7169]|uniref:polysaccharide pyruvyl transferase family protein n=1 Tax=Nocardioides sp. zg-DK7169 TaxID=2736600 RepID=UPI0015555C4F|nr:polysaccharide pyruvyl transferase family protein [Nocardioides sp. zg-DK7169]NPC97275.1 polysaccharide pyruvyl transferase family protein [Nocardioides sp. zg-DK7169]
MSSVSESAGDGGLTRALMINAYSYKNAGDAAIMLSSARILFENGFDEVVISSRYDDGANYRPHGVGVVSELIPFPNRGDTSALGQATAAAFGLTAAALCIAVGTFLPRVGRVLSRFLLPRTRGLHGRYQLLAIAGGGYMYSAKRLLNLSLWHSLLTIRLAQLHIGKTAMFPQSLGPVNNAFDRWVIERALSRTQVIVRERESLERSVCPPRVSVSAVVPDVAFYPFRDGDEVAAVSSIPTVRIAVMDWRWSTSVSAEAFDRYKCEISKLISLLDNAGYRVVLGGHSRLPEHDQDDIAVARVIAEGVSSATEVDDNCDVSHLLSMYQSAQVVIGTRLHACIMALSVGTPAIALAYQSKAVGVMRDSGLEQSTFMADQFRADEVFNRVRSLTQGGDARRRGVGRSADMRARVADHYGRVLK